MIRESIPKVVSGTNLAAHEARAVMVEMLSGIATDAQIGAFLTALSMKGETEEELFSFASVMKQVLPHDQSGRQGADGRHVWDRWR